MKAQTNATVEDIENDIKAKREQKINEFMESKCNQLTSFLSRHEKKSLIIIFVLSSILFIWTFSIFLRADSLYSMFIGFIWFINIYISMCSAVRLLYLLYIYIKDIITHKIIPTCIDGLSDESLVHQNAATKLQNPIPDKKHF